MLQIQNMETHGKWVPCSKLSWSVDQPCCSWTWVQPQMQWEDPISAGGAEQSWLLKHTLSALNFLFCLVVLFIFVLDMQEHLYQEENKKKHVRGETAGWKRGQQTVLCSRPGRVLTGGMHASLTGTCCPHFKENKENGGQKRKTISEEETGGTEYKTIKTTFHNVTKIFRENLNRNQWYISHLI